MSNPIVVGSNPTVNVNIRTLTDSNVAPVVFKTSILRPNIVNDVNIITPEMVNKANYKYVIKSIFSLGDVIAHNLSIDSVNSIIIDGVTYYYKELTIEQGKSFKLLDTEHYTLLDSNYQIITDVVASATYTNITVIVASTTFGTTTGAYQTSNIIRLQEGCILEFDGGKLINGTIVGTNIKLINLYDYEILNNIVQDGTFTVIKGVSV